MVNPYTLYRAEALTLLERVESKEASFVFLDPPWYTRCAFEFESPQSKTRKSDGETRNFLSYISRILQQTRRVLAASGSVCLRSNVWRGRDFQLLMDQVFGRKNFVSQFVWRRQRTPISSWDPGQEHELLLVYRKTDQFEYKKTKKRLSSIKIQERSFSEDQRGRYRLVELLTPIEKAPLQFEWKGYYPPPKRSWKFTEEKLNELYQQGRIYESGSGTLTRLKVYLDELEIGIGSIWDDVPTDDFIGEEGWHYYSAKPPAVTKRILEMTTEVGDLVVDPMCRSGALITSCQQLGRPWIGSDSEEKSIEVTVQRLKQLGLELHKDFQVADQVSLDKGASVAPFYYSPLVLPEDIDKKPLIVTEGKTDWKHMKAAFRRLKSSGYLEDFDIEFREYEEEINMGDQDLLNLCRNLSKLIRLRKVICIFDSDNDQIVQKVSGEDKKFKEWENNVFSFALPIPEHREGTSGVCIELYYRDEDIMTCDQENRRLYLSKEFDPETGQHQEKPNIRYRFPERLRPNTTRVIDSEVVTENDVNVALPKAKFAEYVLNGVAGFQGFEVDSFKRLLEVIIEIARL